MHTLSYLAILSEPVALLLFRVVKIYNCYIRSNYRAVKEEEEEEEEENCFSLSLSIFVWPETIL